MVDKEKNMYNSCHFMIMDPMIFISPPGSLFLNTCSSPSDHPKEIIDKYNLTDLEVKGLVYIEIRKGIPGLKQAGKLQTTVSKNISQNTATTQFLAQLHCGNIPHVASSIPSLSTILASNTYKKERTTPPLPPITLYRHIQVW